MGWKTAGAGVSPNIREPVNSRSEKKLTAKNAEDAKEISNS